MSCPVCQKPVEKAYRPFCSKRCADVDLGRWLNGSYAVPGEPAILDETTETPPETHH
jgi:endogenous inhibitor of DNA gyrase (YacG/DUF329 family)